MPNSTVRLSPCAATALLVCWWAAGCRSGEPALVLTLEDDSRVIKCSSDGLAEIVFLEGRSPAGFRAFASAYLLPCDARRVRYLAQMCAGLQQNRGRAIESTEGTDLDGADIRLNEHADAQGAEPLRLSHREALIHPFWAGLVAEVEDVANYGLALGIHYREEAEAQQRGGDETMASYQYITALQEIVAWRQRRHALRNYEYVEDAELNLHEPLSLFESWRYAEAVEASRKAWESLTVGIAVVREGSCTRVTFHDFEVP